MLLRINDLPKDKKIAGVHSVPITEQGTAVMAWDQEEQVLTTIGGRIEQHETIQQALNRETLEEIGATLQEQRIPFATWYWQETDTYTVYFLSKIDSYLTSLPNNEKTGYVISNFETLRQMVSKVEGRGKGSKSFNMLKSWQNN